MARRRIVPAFRRSAQVACGLLAISVGLGSCSQADCAALAICAASMTDQDAEGAGAEELDAGPDAHQNPTAQGAHCAGMGRACAGDDCCRSTLVPGGTFKRSFDGVPGGEFDDPSFVATVTHFRLDVYEITIGRFRAFLADYPRTLPIGGAGRNPSNPGDGGWDAAWNAAMPQTAAKLSAELHCESANDWTDSPADAETKPMPCLTWYEAFAFCIWDGGRLPTEAEWNYAAAGGSEQRVYPWSSPPSSSKVDEEHAAVGSNGGARAVSPVGSKPKGTSRWGHADLGGNVWEWTADAWRDPYAITPCNDCRQLPSVSAPARVVRGGSVFFAEENARASVRSNAPPTERKSIFGARCARAT